MSFPPSEFWPGWQNASDLLQEADDDFFNAFVNLDPEAFEYPQAPSTFDESSTIIGSELDVPALTSGQTLTASTSTRSKTSPSLGPPEESDPYHGLGFSLPRPGPNEGGNGLGFSLLEKSSLFRHIGENPEIRIQESLSSPPKQLCLDDANIGLSPRSPLLSAGSPSPVSMKRGRSNPLPAEKRVKVSTMRKIKACPWCRIHKVECKEVMPCDHCKKNFPGYPEEACDRAKLCEVRFPEYYQPTSIWLHNPRGAVPHRDAWQASRDQTTTMNFDRSFGESTGLAPALQAYVASPGRFPLLSQGYYPPYSPAVLSGASLSTAGTRPGSFMHQRSPGGLVLDEPRSSPDELLPWVEGRLSTDFENDKGRRFPAAVGAILLAYRDSSLGTSASRATNEKKQASVDSAKELVRKVLKMQCWLRVWQQPALYYRIQGSQSAGAGLQSSPGSISEVRRTAITALIACEREILTELDELPFKLNREVQLPIWACLWQMILTYRDLINEYKGVNHGLTSLSNINLGHNTVLEDAPNTVERLHRLLVIKYAAYIGSSSPIFPKRGQEDIHDLLSGDQHLQHEWNNVLERRKDFYRTHLGDVPCDAFLKALIIDKEANMERRRRRKPK